MTLVAKDLKQMKLGNLNNIISLKCVIQISNCFSDAQYQCIPMVKEKMCLNKNFKVLDPGNRLLLSDSTPSLIGG